jgi:hypothetical protein
MVPNRVEIRRVLCRVQRYLCDYAFEKDKDEPSGFCDCKYGGGHITSRQGCEDNGCPEVRTAVAVFGALTDAEYKGLFERLERRARRRLKKTARGKLA